MYFVDSALFPFLYEWAFQSSKHRWEGEKQKGDWPRQTSLQHMLSGASSKG